MAPLMGVVMRTSKAGYGLIKRFEGLRLDPYLDAAGYPTVGWGHLLSKEKGADLSQWSSIDKKEAIFLLQKDAEHHEAAVNRLIRVPLSQGQFDALVSFTFNLGAGALQASTLRRVINRGDYQDAPDQLRRWVFAGGRNLKGLARRRDAEVALGSPWERN